MINLFKLWVAIVAMLIAFFEALQNTATEDTKQITALWIKKKSLPDHPGSLRFQILLIFDSLFDSRIVSIKFLCRSLFATLIGISFSVIIWVIIYLYTGEFDKLGAKDPLWSIVILMAIIFNFIPDYFSLIETRMVIGEMQKHNTKASIIFFIIFDFFLTTSIYSLYVTLVGSLFSVVYTNNYFPLINKHIITGLFVALFLGIFSTYLTSIWVWIYSITGIFLRMLSLIGKPFFLLRDKILNVDEFPFRVMGIFSSILFTIFFSLIIICNNILL